MESHAQATEDYLIEGLSFKLAPGASYVTNRRSVTFYPQGGNSYAPKGVKVFKLNLMSSKCSSSFSSCSAGSLNICYDI